MRLLHTVLAIALAVPIAAVSAPNTPAGAAPSSRQRIEAAYRSSSPITSVVSSVVHHRVPLPTSAGPHPAACDWVSYLRFRSADGPRSSADADRILIAQPGVFEGAGAFGSVARNTIVKAAAQGRHIEFWALDRRSNCLEDHTGLQAGTAQRSFRTAADYYLHGSTINGRTFADFTDNLENVTEYAWLNNVGLKQTLDDQYAVMTAEIPSRQARKQKFLCGGHSLGGFITGYFAEWDFDGDRRTRGDAGYNQCGGYFALDTAVSSDMSVMAGALDLPPDLSSLAQIPRLPSEAGQALDVLLGLADSALPVMALPTMINPETMNLLALTALAADTDPQGVNAVLQTLPHNLNVDSTLRILLSRDYGAAVTGSPDVRRLNATNEAVLGAIMDDNTMPFGILQASVGMFAPGGPVVRKSFPMPDGVAAAFPMSHAIWGDNAKFAPSATGNDVLYRWADYDQITPGLRGKTTPAQEVTSISELARSMSEPPLDFTEWYFPTALTMELSNSSGPNQARHRRYPGAALRAPMLTLQAGGGLGIGRPHGHGALVTLPGYSHLDVLTAAYRQNDGRPEQVSENLARMAVNPTAMR